MLDVKSYIKKKVLKNQIARNITLITGGTAFSQFLGILFSPIITRIYPPEQYGILTAFSALLGFVVISASLDYQKAIPISENDDQAINLIVLSTVFLVLTVIIISILLVLYGDFFLDLLDSNALLPYKFIIPIGLLLMGLYNIVLQWGYRERNYKIITKTKISQSFVSNLAKVILGIMNLGPIGLISGVIIGKSAGIMSLMTLIYKKANLFSNISICNLKKVLKRYKNFPLYSAPSNYVYVAGNNLPVVLLATLFGSTVTGLFGLAKSITELPMSLIGMSVAQVFYSESASIGKDNPQKIKLFAIKLIKKMAIIALIPLITLLLFGPWLFSFVFGNQWYEAGVYSRILSLMVYFHFIVIPVGRVLEIFEKQREGLFLNIFRLAIIVLVFLISKIYSLSSYASIALYSIANSITYVVLLLVVMRVLNIEIKSANEKSMKK